MKDNFLEKIDSLEKLPAKVKKLLLQLIKNFEKEKAYDDYWDKQKEVIDAFSELCKYFLGDVESYYHFFLDEFDEKFLRLTGYNHKIATKYCNFLEKLRDDILNNQKIDYSRFCHILQRFDRYFTIFKWQLTIPETLSHCLQILYDTFWDTDYKYIDLKMKIDRKIRLVLVQYDHSCLSKYPEDAFKDEEYCDEYEENLIFEGFPNPVFYDDIKKDHIYLSCCFDKELEGETFYYRTVDDSIELGNEIIVPVGKDNIQKHAWVANKEYFFTECVPLSIKQTKEIICKVNNK